MPAYASADTGALDFVVHNFHFDQFDVDGFKSPTITHSVHKDSHGRIWIGTESGLYLYDGNDVQRYFHDPADARTIPAPFVKVIRESPDGTLWIGTWGGGLAYYNEQTHSFHRVVFDDSDEIKHGPEFDGRVWTMEFDSKGRIWIGTFTSGLFRYDPTTNRLLNAFVAGSTDDTRHNRINALLVDNEDRVWFSPFQDGLRVIDSDTFEPAVKIPENLVHAEISDLDELNNHRVLISRWNAIDILDSGGELLSTLPVTWNTSNEIIMTALPYSDNEILLGTAGGNLWYVNWKTAEKFPIPTGKHPGAMEPSIVWDMKLSKDGDILVGGTTGLWIAPIASRQFWTITGLDDREPVFFRETRAIFFDGQYLFLNSGTTIYQLDFNGQLNSPQQVAGKVFGQTAGRRPLWMEQSKDGRLWIATDRKIYFADSGKPLQAVPGISGAQMLYNDTRTGRILTDSPWGFIAVNDVVKNGVAMLDKGSVSDRRPWAQYLARGSHDDFWSGTLSGIARYHAEDGSPLPVFTEDAENSEWNDPYVGFIHREGKDELYIGTLEGLWHAKLNANGAITQLLRMFEDTPYATSPFEAVVRRGDVLLFVAQPVIIEYNPASKHVEIVGTDEGIPSYGVYSGGFRFFKQTDLMILSGHNGPLLLHPGSLSLEAPDRRLIISKITSFRDNSIIEWPISASLQFHHSDRVIRFKFGMMDYLNPLNDHYSIRLTGFRSEWLDIDNQQEFSFTNLDSGEYRLDIRVSDGQTGNTRIVSLPFSVLPPWWQTWWAYALYAFLFIGSLFWYWWSLQRKLERERDLSQRLREADRIKSHFLNELEDKVEDATRDLRHAVEALEIKNVELDAAQHRALDASRLKSEFLANMSHEIRTPMNGVLGFTQLLRKSKLDNDQQDYVETIEKSARSLLGIINDVLDVSKIEAGKLMIDSTGFDVRTCISDTLEALAPVAYEKNLELVGHYEENLPDGLRGDPTRIRQMITNLVGNAIKFTNAGTVLVHLEAHSDDDGVEWLRIRVSDTGRGISAEDRERLFQAFERGSISLTSRYTGTGLGLVITKKLCEAMGGRIELDSAPGHGTRVILDLPLVADRNPENTYGSGKPLSDRSVLLVDSHAHSRDAARSRLVYWGADVTAVASLVTPVTGTFDIAVIGVERKRLDDMQWLQSQIGHLPAELPRICLVASVDRDALRTLSESSRATCVSKIGHLQGQLRRIMEPIGIAAETARVNIDVDAGCRLDELHVVVADDNRINRYFIKKILELHGARVTEADSGTAVLRRLGELASSDNVDIVLLDVHMPDVDGLEVARRIRAGGEHRLPLLAVSANVQPETYEAAIAAGINDYLLKPVEESKLVEAVLEWTGREKEVTSDE